MTGKEAMALAMKVIDKALDKADEEELMDLGRSDLNVWIPEGLSGEDIVLDLYNLKQNLTPLAAERIVEELELEMSAEEYGTSILGAVPRRAGVYLRTQAQDWEAREQEEMAYQEQSRSSSSPQ